MVGIIQEQHPDRCRLFMQWKQMEWPILVDSLDLLGVSGVPLTIAIDEHGIVRATGLRLAEAGKIEESFLDQEYDTPPDTAATAPAAKPDLGALEQRTHDGGAAAWRRYGDALVLWGGENRIDDAIAAYRQAIKLAPEDGPSHFRLGVALRMRYDLGPNHDHGGDVSDFQEAVESWRTALDIDPNQYIWRRRIQQYGPRLDKPYPFYDWVAGARREIRARGETPAELRVEPGGAEFAKPSDTFAISAAPATEPDPKGRIRRDTEGLIELETVVVPPTVAPGGSARVHLIFRPNQAIQAHWNNEAGDMEVWLDSAGDWELSRRRLSISNPPELVSIEDRHLEFEVKAPAGAKPGPHSLTGYALYYVCEDAGGTCLYRRQDIKIPLRLEKPAPPAGS